MLKANATKLAKEETDIADIVAFMESPARQILPFSTAY